jgi:hypothetical protein
MNANALHPGHEYAYVRFPRKNVRYRPEATRVRVLHVYKLEDQFSTKKKSYVEVVQLDEDGNRVTDHNDEELPIKTITARQLYTTWGEHLVEREKYRQETEERRAYQRRLDEQQEQRQREYEEQLKRERMEEERKKERILQKLEEIGIPRDVVRIDSYAIRIDRIHLERRLNAEQDIDARAGAEPVGNTVSNFT